LLHTGSKEAEMINSGDLAKYRMADRMREAAAYRQGSETRTGHRVEVGAKLRRVTATAVSMLLWPIRH
jgi:hypothetical protein